MNKAIPILLFLSAIVFGSCNNKSNMVLKNKNVAFTFEEGSYSLIGLSDRGAQKEHIFPDSPAGELWQLSFAKDEKVISTSNILSQPGVGKITRNSSGGKILSILWNDLGLAELSDVQVEVRINLADDSGIADWHIKVNNDSEEWGLWEVSFPKVSGFLDSTNYDVFGTFGHRDGRSETWGSLYKNYSGRLDMRYPVGWGNMSMQFIGASLDRNSIYMAIHDPLAWKKNFVIEPGNEYYVRVFAEDMGVPGSDFDDPFPFMFGVFRGNWLEAAKIYREFALTTPWVSKGKLSEAESTPQSFKDVALWMRGWEYPVSEPTEYQKKMDEWKSALEFFGVPMGFHWYNWSINEFDTHYPHFFPVKKGVKEFARELTDMGVVVMPYINGRIVDMRNEDISEFVPLAAKKYDGTTYEERYRNQVPQMVMCPTSKAYQDTIAMAVKSLAEDIGFNSVYIDQIAAAPSNLCFDKTHGHPLGGGSWWIEGYRQMLGKVQDVAHSEGRNLSITSECTAEAYMDGIDGYLLVNPRSDKSIPLLAAVYSSYTIYFASWLEGMKSDRVFISTIGRDVIWGCKPGWFDFDIMFSPEHKKKLEYFRSLGQVHNAGRKYFVYGEFLAQSESEEKCTETGIPLQMYTVWRSENGSLALAVANFSEEDASFDVDLNLSDYTHNASGFNKTYDLINATESDIKIIDQKINESMDLGPLEIKIIEILI